jgi:hypothetical protein
MKTPRPVVAFVLALGCTFPARGEIYRWTDAEGRVQFSDLLGRLFDRLGRVGPGKFSGADTIDAAFAGGLDALESRWLAWVLAPKRAHYY